MTDADEPPSAENLSVLFTAGLVENVLLHREERDYPRKLLRAGQLLLQSLYASDLLVCCSGGEPLSVSGAHGPMLLAATDPEAAQATVQAVFTADATATFEPASALSAEATRSGNWKSRRDAWREIFRRAGGVYMLLNPAGPATARILGVALDDGKPARFGRLALPPEDAYERPQDRTRGRGLTPEAVAEFAPSDA